MSTLIQRGTVSWFNDARGYGFISPEEGKDVFVHWSSIVGNGHRSLTEGEEVEFEVVESDRGLAAANVRRL